MSLADTINRPLVEHYNEELAFFSKLGEEFAQEHGLGERLGLGANGAPDPYTERLLQGVAFLSARVRVEMDAQFSVFAQHLLEITAPDYLTPMPSMLIAEMQPRKDEPNLASGKRVPAGSYLQTGLSASDSIQTTRCIFRTAHDVTLWPIELAEAIYTRNLSEAETAGLSIPGASVLRLRFRTTAELKFNELALGPDAAPLAPTIYLREDRRDAHRLFKLYELLFSKTCRVLWRGKTSVDRVVKWSTDDAADALGPVGFSDAESLLPAAARTLRGFRLLREFFAMPNRFSFVRIGGLDRIASQLDSNECELSIVFSEHVPELEALTTKNFSLYCTPAINLFKFNNVMIQRREGMHHEHKVTVDQQRSNDYEVFAVNRVWGKAGDKTVSFLPLYATQSEKSKTSVGYFSARRLAAIADHDEMVPMEGIKYRGSDVFVSLVQLPVPSAIDQGLRGEALRPNEVDPGSAQILPVRAQVLCTNRNLPRFRIRAGQSLYRYLFQDDEEQRDTTQTESSAGNLSFVEHISCITLPTPTHAPLEQGVAAWRLVSHLALNYISFMQLEPRQAAERFRDMIALYGVEGMVGSPVDSIESIESKHCTARFPGGGPLCFARGVEVSIFLNETKLANNSAYLFGRVLAELLASFMSINAFVKVEVKSTTGREILKSESKEGLIPTL